MRLTDHEIQIIKNSCFGVFGNGSIYLFGSRVDDTARGGDIDLYIIPDQAFPMPILLEKKLEFLVQIKNQIGEQKIDVVIARDQNRLIEKEALQKGIRL